LQKSNVAAVQHRSVVGLECLSYCVDVCILAARCSLLLTLTHFYWFIDWLIDWLND